GADMESALEKSVLKKKKPDASKKFLRKMSSIWYRVAENIDNDFLEIFLITSQSAGMEPSMGRAFGVGKSSLSIWMAYRAHAYARGLIRFEKKGEELVLVDEASEKEKLAVMEDVVRKYTFWNILDVVKKIQTTREHIPALIWDDVQRTCPAWQHIAPKLRAQIEYLTMARQRVANIILTAPAMSDIARPLRRNVTWEIIVPQRGIYEVQFLVKHRDFYNPDGDLGRLWYEATGTFSPLPAEIDGIYKRLREKTLDVLMLEEDDENG
ncbi:MAG: hypothetical protein QW087_07810, partial [Methanomassiliicoccales archaeon]